jgi:hypothetical protein
MAMPGAPARLATSASPAPTSNDGSAASLPDLLRRHGELFDGLTLPEP